MMPVEPSAGISMSHNALGLRCFKDKRLGWGAARVLAGAEPRCMMLDWTL